MLLADKIETLWEYYTQKKFHEIKDFFKNQNIQDSNENLKELYYLSLLELQEYPVHNGKTRTGGIFKELLEAMTEYHAGNYHHTAKKLVNWITQNGIYADWIIDRFFESAKKSQLHDAIIKLTNYFLKRGILHQSYIRELFKTYYNLKEYEKALEVFEQYRELFDDNELYNVGIVLLKVRRFKEAERIFLTVYKKITGKEYQNNYEQYESYYKQKYHALKQKYINNELQTEKELTEFGMACLFSGDYRNALQIFTHLKKQLENTKT